MKKNRSSSRKGLMVISRPMNKDEHREQLAEMFVNLLEEKDLKWKSGLKSFRPNAHHNGVTKSNYKGLNTFTLALVSLIKGYEDPRWVTMNQIMDKGNKYHPNQKWHLQKGSKATFVEYWYPYDLENKVALTWDQYKQALRNGAKPENYTLNTKYTGVFNASCVDGMPELAEQVESDLKLDELVTKLSENMNVPILYDSNRTPCYVPRLDKIYLPHKESFDTEYNFNSTALHELAHSTGHSSRLNRDLENSFGTEDYAYEELVAEMSACFMSADIEANQDEEYIENHKAYVQSWIRKIREKPEMLVKAIKDAQECAKYMDFKAGLINEQEYLSNKNSVKEVTVETENTQDNVQENSQNYEQEAEGFGMSM